MGLVYPLLTARQSCGINTRKGFAVSVSCTSRQGCSDCHVHLFWTQWLQCVPTRLLPAEPTAKKFTEGQLKPAADKVAANAKPMADKFNAEQLQSAADKIAQNAKPTAEKLADQQIKPAAQKLSEQAVPRTKDFTEGTLQPAAKRLADNAEPLGEKLIKKGVEPLAEVCAAGCWLVGVVVLHVVLWVCKQ